MCYQPHHEWIAADTWALIDQQTVTLKCLANPDELQPLWKAICKKICHDCVAHLTKTDDEIQAHWDANSPKEAWWLVKVWYWQQA